MLYKLITLVAVFATVSTAAPVANVLSMPDDVHEMQTEAIPTPSPARTK